MAITQPNFNSQFSELIIHKPAKINLAKYACDYKAAEVKKAGLKKAHNLASEVLEHSRQELILAHEKLWANKKYGILIVLQGMDTAGKDGAIRHILSGINPQGCRIHGFKVPTADEHAHSFLWRYQKVAPARGEVVVFNRSHYEDVLAVKVHPENMEQLPLELSLAQNKQFWLERYADINAFEQHLAKNGVLVLKFFLHISKAEQKKRLVERLTLNEKLWKVSAADLHERKFWDHYLNAYEDLLGATGNSYAPWIIVPSNDKKIARAIIANMIADSINGLGLDFPKLSRPEIEQLHQAKLDLEAEEA